MATQLGFSMALILFGSAIGYVAYKVLHRYRVRRLVPKLTVQQVMEKITAGEAPVFIDLRSHGARQEIQSIPGSLPLSVEEVLAGHHTLPRDRDVILYCACPEDAASMQVAWRLRERGLTRVWSLAGGIEAWNALQVEQGEFIGAPEDHTVAA